MAGALARRCHLLAVVSAQAENLGAWRRSAGELFEVPTFSSARQAALSLVDLKRHRDLARRIRAYSPDAIYYPMGHLFTPIVNSLLPGIPKVTTIHDPVLHLGEKNPLVNLLQRLEIRQSERVIVLSRHCATQLAGLGVPASKIDVVPHGELSLYRGGAPEPGGAGDGNTLLFFGRIARYKGVDVLLEAFRQVLEHRPASRLLLVGQGDLGPYERSIAALPNLRVVNRWIPDDEVHGFFARADVVVLPYVDGSQSGVVAIASACGLPSVATDVGGVRDQVVDGQTGLVVPRGDAHALAVACLELLESPRLREALGRAAREKAEREWSWDEAAARVLESLRVAATSVRPSGRRGRAIGEGAPR